MSSNLSLGKDSSSIFSKFEAKLKFCVGLSVNPNFEQLCGRSTSNIWKKGKTLVPSISPFPIILVISNLSCAQPFNLDKS